MAQVARREPIERWPENRHQFRHDADPRFFLTTRNGPRFQPKKSVAREMIISLRKQNHSVYDISEVLKARKLPLSPTAVGEVFRAESFAPLPRRSDDERPQRPRTSIEVVANIRTFSLAPRRFTTQCGGLFLFLPDLARLHAERWATAAHLPGSKMIPAAAELRASLALKLWSLPRKSHVMVLAADEGLALFAGLNATPKKSFLSEYSCRITPRQTRQLVAAWHSATTPDALLTGDSFNLDFHSIPYHGKDPQVESHYVSAQRSRRQPSILVFLAQNEANHTFCYANAGSSFIGARPFAHRVGVQALPTGAGGHPLVEQQEASPHHLPRIRSQIHGEGQMGPVVSSIALRGNPGE